MEGSLKNDLEIDTIENDDEKDSIEVQATMTKYPNIPFNFNKIRIVKKSCVLTEKVWNLKNRTPTLPLLPLKLSIFNFIFFRLKIVQAKLED